MNAVLVFRSLLFNAGFAIAVGVFSLLAASLGRLMPIGPRQTLATTGNFIIIKWLRITCGVRLEVRGRENIPATPFVALSNHQSPWETFFLQRDLRPVSTILKKELLKVPFFGWGLASVKPIAIDRDNPRQALKDVIEQGKARLASGMNVIVFPEGTRMNYGEYGKHARSGASLAVAAGVPVLPVAHNAGKYWPSKEWIKRPGTITLVYGPLIDTTGLDAKTIAGQAEEWIKSTQSSL